MSADYVELTRQGYDEFAEGRPLTDDDATADFVWDMSKFAGWMEQPCTRAWQGWKRS